MSKCHQFFDLLAKSIKLNNTIYFRFFYGGRFFFAINLKRTTLTSALALECALILTPTLIFVISFIPQHVVAAAIVRMRVYLIINIYIHVHT